MSTDNAMRVRLAHTIDSYETMRGNALRVVQDHREMLELALHALRHGSDHVTDEYLERTIEGYDKVVASLAHPPTVK